MSIKIKKKFVRAKNFITKKIKIFDAVFIAVFLATVFLSFAFAFQKKSGKSMLIVNTPEGEFVYDLAKSQTVSVCGPLGTSIIEIHNGHAHFVDSPCPNKICVHAAAVSKSGEWSACLPNRIFMHIESDSTQTLDAIVE